MKRNIALLLLVSLLALCFSSCSISSYEYDMFAMDTLLNIKVFGCDKSTADEMFSECEDTVSQIEKSISFTDENSELYALNQNKKTKGSEIFREVLNTAITLSAFTNGAYDPSLGILKTEWAINDETVTVIPTDEQIDFALLHSGIDKINIDENRVTITDDALTVDMGGIGKGYALDALNSVISKYPVKYAVVTFGGSVGLYGEKPGGSYSVGIKNPFEDGNIGTLTAKEGYISVSGGYERYKEIDGIVYHHIFDKDTGYPSDNELASVAAYAKEGVISDALSTALFVMGYEKGIELYNTQAVAFDALFVFKDGSVKMTDGIKESFTVAK